MTGRLAIIACAGDLPVLLHEHVPDAMVVTFAGIESALGPVSQRHSLEKIGTLFAAMTAEGVSDVIFAGALTRPALNRAEFDQAMMAIAPRLMAAMSLGDDGLLRTVIDVFEEQGFAVRGVLDVRPDLVASAELAIGPDPTPSEEKDIARATEILKQLAPIDVGQGCAVAGGQCLGIETVQGTDAVLGFVAQTPAQYRQGGLRGVYVKATKTGQDLRMDMPVIGPDTINAVAKAGLAGMVVEAGRVLIIDREATVAAAQSAEIFLCARAF
ncbi:MAG: UDP-2,3-diacylglucosamine diphosphatase LpxI [Pseudomonadota bacterium]